MALENLLLRLLEKMESISEESSEVFDTEVREKMGLAIMEGFVRRQSGYQMPDDFGMASEDANTAVKSAIIEYVDLANVEAESLGITRFRDRLAAFQNSLVRTDRRKGDYEEFFGHTPPEFYSIDGAVIRTI